MTENLNLKYKYIYIKGYSNNIYYVKNDGKYLFLVEIICDKYLCVDNNILLTSCNNKLIYKHFCIGDVNNNTGKTKKIYKQTYINYISIIDNIDDVYIITNQTNNNFVYELHHDYNTSLFYKNEKRLSYKIYIANCVLSVYNHLDSNNEATIKLRNEFYNLHISQIQAWKIDIMKENIESYNKYLIVINKYKDNTDKFRDTLINYECGICLENKTIHTYYRCYHYFCSDCFNNWNNIKKHNCPLCRGH